MRMALALTLCAMSRTAFACPACAGARTGGPSALHLVLVVLPFVIAAVAARAIYRALRD